jgi:hypothetical protein
VRNQVRRENNRASLPRAKPACVGS